MHMANELLSPATALGSGLIALGGIGYASRGIRDQAATALAPLMGVMGAFVFAAQMINFTLPAMAGTSDHIIGTIFLTILLGPHAAVITMTGVLVIQCLIFQDGGLLALGANIINMGILPAYGGWAMWKGMTFGSRNLSRGRFLASVWTAAFVAVVLGAAGVCVEVGLSNRLAIPLSAFSGAMIGVHLLSATIEGVITCVVLAFLFKVHPELSGMLICWTDRRIGIRNLSAMVITVSVIVGGVVSWLASPYADGLEWAADHHNALKAKSELAARVDSLQDKYTPLPDYTKRSAEPNAEAASTAERSRWLKVDGWTSVSGVAGVAISLAVIWGLGRVLGSGKRVKATVL